jgi:glycosyltransferase involved in cell wall biosynthesis
MGNEKKDFKKRTYRVGIDARFFGLENKGLGRYTKELVEQLDKTNQKLIASSKQSVIIEYYIFLRDNNFDNYKPHAKNIHKIKADYQWYSWKEQLFFPRLLKKYHLDLVHFTHFNAPIFYKGKFIVTIHDLILFHYPTVKNTTLNKTFYYFKLAIYHLAIRVVARRAELIIAISKFTKKDIIDSLGAKKEKIKVIYEGAEFTSSQDNLIKTPQKESTIFKKYGILKKYLLYVGNAYPHKNLERLVLAFEKIGTKNKNKLQLVLVGKKDYFYSQLEKFVDKNKIKGVIITDYISDYELEELYCQTELFVFPSLYEGFGLPPLEALVRGVPVVSSAKSSLAEILENKVRYFNPESVESIKEGIENTLLSGGVVLTPAEIKEIKNKYNWKGMTEQTTKVYKKTVSNFHKKSY